MAYTPPRYTQAVAQSSFTEYFPCDYCKGPLGADSTAHCRGCGAPRKTMPPLFNVTSLYPPQDLAGWAAGSLQHQLSWTQQYLGIRQLNDLENALGSRGRW